jgi:aspartyl-tRNA(Asn)/glutamyl-tRNA(Gln) amidotransferase subunit B
VDDQVSRPRCIISEMSKKLATYLLNGGKQVWEQTIGLEIHAQVLSKSKLFSGSNSVTAMLDEVDSFGSVTDDSTMRINNSVSLFDAAFPGTLPRLNRFVVTQAIKACLVLQCEINRESVFERKHYFYADLPLGYQITQLRKPIGVNGKLLFDVPSLSTQKMCGIERIQIEQDSGKSNHTLHPTKSLIDLNRAGVALLEIVTRPDIKSAEEAVLAVKKIQVLLRHFQVSSCSMEDGSFRCDVNVSIKPQHTKEFGERVEMKNLNSLKAIEKSIMFETQRQVDILDPIHVLPKNENSNRIMKETRLFDVESNTSTSLRSKEDDLDYRFMVEPDLLPVRISDDDVSSIQSSLPPSLDELRDDLVTTHGISVSNATTLINQPGGIELFQRTRFLLEEKFQHDRFVNKKELSILLGSWIINELLGKAATLLRDDNSNMSNKQFSTTRFLVDPIYLAELLCMLKKEEISGKIAKLVLPMLISNPEHPWNIIERNNWYQISDEPFLLSLCEEAIKLPSMKQSLEKYQRTKNDRLVDGFILHVMEKTQGRANPALTRKLMVKILSTSTH